MTRQKGDIIISINETEIIFLSRRVFTMYRIAIVDDETAQLNELAGYARRYSEENDIELNVEVFNNTVDFITDFRASFDIIFLDIKMPDINGLEAARRLRNVDANVPIIFITSMSQYAINGYEVSALDFVVKPVNYFVFSQKLKRAISYAKSHRWQEYLLSYGGKVLRVGSDEILYIEKVGNYIVFCTDKGDFRMRGTMDEWASKLGKNFSRSLRGCLVNLAYVLKIDKNSVCVGKHTLPLSRGCRKQFIEDLAAYKSGS